MIRLEFQSGPGFAENIRVILSATIDQIGQGVLPESESLPQDEDLRDIWVGEIESVIRQDLEVFQKVLDHPRFDDGIVEIKAEQAEALLRAAAALRMGIRRVYLADFDDADLENSRVHEDGLDDDTYLFFVTFLFLAGFQELLVEAMDHSAGFWSEDDDDEFEFDDEDDEDGPFGL